MEKPRKILKSPSVKRRNRIVPVNQRVTLERVIGLTASSNATLACDANTGTVAYPAGCVVVLFNPRRTKQSHILNFSKKTLTAVAFSPDGKHIVTGESGHQPAVRVWNVDDKSQVSELHGHKFGINCVAFSPNLKYLVSIGSQHDMMVNVWNWKTGTKVASNKISSKVNAVAFSEDGSMFVTVGNRHVKFWYLDSSKSRVNETVPLLGRSGILGEQKNNFFCDVACGKGSTSKCVFTITQSGLLCQFNEKRLLDKWVELRANTASCLSVGEDNIFIGCANGVVRVFSAHTLYYTTTLPHPHYLGVDVASALSPSQMICNKEDAKYPDTVALVFDDIHKKVTCIYNDHSLYMWDVHDVKKVGKAWSFLYHSSCVWGLEVAPPVQEGRKAVLPPGSFITCSSDDTIRIWNIDPHMEPTASVKRNVFSNELLKILYIDPTLASLRDVNYNPAGGTDKTDTNYDGKNGVRSVCISPDGDHLASGDRIGNVRIHDLESMKELHAIEAHDGEVLCLEYSHVETGPKLLSSTSRDRLVHVFDVEQKYGLLQTLDDHSSSITAVKFTDNDNQLKMLSCGADKSLLFRSAQMSPDFQFSLSQHLVGKTTLYDMDVDPTQKFVATACQDRNIRIYNIKTAKQKKSYKGSAGDDGTLIRLKLDPSGSYIATTCTDKNLCVLDFCSGELVATSYGHSELSTGVKFTNDLKHLISVSGDGCIFIWRLSGEMTRQMQGRLEELGQLPVEAQTHEVMDKTVTLESLIPNDKEFKSPRKVLEELTKENEMRSKSPEKSQDYRFSVGQLPKWAKSKVGEDKSKSSSPDDQGSSLPKGRWAQRVDNKKLLAQLDSKSLQSDIGSDRNTRKFHVEPSDDTDGDNRRETMVLAKPENTPRKIPVIFDDETNGDDDDEDFFPSFHKKVDDDSIWDESYKSPPFNQDSRNTLSPKRLSFTFTRNNSQDDIDDLDSDTPEVIYYPPSEADSTETNGTSFTVFAGNNNDTLGKTKKSLPRPIGLERSLDGDSESTDPVSLEDIDDDDDSLSIPSNPATPSEEMIMKTPDREKYLKDTFENLNFSPVPIENFEKKLDDMERQADSEMLTTQTGDLLNSRLSISSRFLSRAQQANMRTACGGIQRQDNWFDSVQKRKDAMARAVDETRKRLLAMGWKDQSPEPDQPEKDSEPTKPKPDNEDTGITLEDLKEQKTPTNKASSTTSSSSQGLPQRPRTPKSLRRCWSSFDLPKTPIVEEKPPLTYSVSNPSTPLSKSPHGKKPSAIPKCSGVSASAATKNKPSWRSRIPTPTSVSSRRASPRAASNRGNVWDTRSESSDDSFNKTPTNKTEGSMPVPPPRGRRSRPVTLTLGEKKKDGTEQVGRITPTMLKSSGRSQSHSSMHRKQTESSKAKILKSTSSSNLAKDNKTETPKTFSKSTSMQNLSNNKLSLPKSKLKSTKLSSLYTSTPDLAGAFQNDEEEIESSNLKFSGRLSGSVPDLLDSDSEKSAKKSEKTKSSNGKAPSDNKRFSTGTSAVGKKMAKAESKASSSSRSQRLSLPTGGASVNVERDKNSRVRKSDVDLMPPPSSVSVAKTKADTSKQDDFIKKAMQSKRKPPQSASEMTLDMAKNILRGKSGILESEEPTSDSNNVPSVSSTEVDKLTTVTTTSSFSSRTPAFTSTFPVYTMASTTSAVYTTSCTVSSSTLSSSSASISITTTSSAGPFLHEDTNVLKVAAEIESTAAEIRHRNALEAAFQNFTVLDASPNDLPERDMAPSQLVPSEEDSGVSQTSTVKGYYTDDNKIRADWSIGKASQSSQSSGIEVDEDGDLPPTASIKERIALLTSHASSHQPHQGANTSRTSSTASSYLSTTPTRISTFSTKNEVSPSISVSGLSPRSSSGIGSSLDSEAASKLFTSPGSSLSPQSNYDLTNTETHNVSDSDDTATKYSPRGLPQSFTSELEFTSNKNITVADALEAVSSGSQSSASHPSTPPLPSSDPPTSQPLSSRSTPSSVISNKSTLIGSPRSNITASPRSNVTGSPRSDLNNSPVVTNGYHSSSPCKQDNLQTCMEAIKDLRQSIKNVTDLYDQVRHGDDSSSEAKNVLEECFTEFSGTFSELVSMSSSKQTPAPQNSENLIILENFKHILSNNNEVLCDRFVQILSTKK